METRPLTESVSSKWPSCQATVVTVPRYEKGFKDALLYMIDWITQMIKPVTQLALGALQTGSVCSLGGKPLFFPLSFLARDWFLFTLLEHLSSHLMNICCSFIHLPHLLYLSPASVRTLVALCLLWCSFSTRSSPSALRLPFASPPLLMRPFSASCRPVLWWERVPSRSATRL